MNLLDGIILVPVLYGAWIGFKKGFVIEVCTLLALVLGVWGGIHFSDYISDQIASAFSKDFKYLPVIAFTLTFMIVAGSVYMLGKLIEKSINLIALKPINKIAGLGFGSLKYLFLMAVCLVLLEAYDGRTDIIDDETKKESLLYSTVQDVALVSVPALEQSKLLFDYAKKGIEMMPEDSTANKSDLSNMDNSDFHSQGLNH